MTAGEREARWGHRGGVLELRGSKEIADAIERSLFAGGAATVRIDGGCRCVPDASNAASRSTTSLAVESGLLVLLVHEGEAGSLTARVKAM